MFINNFFTQQNNNVNYTSRLPKGVFYDAKDIPRLRCAKCNHHMISKNEQRKILYKNEEISNENLIKKIPKNKREKMPEAVAYVAKVLEEKGIKGVSKLFFADKTGESIVGKTNKERKQIREIIKDVYTTYIGKKNNPLTTQQIVKNLGKYKSELPKENQELIDIITNYSKVFPRETLVGIMRKKELYKYHDLIASSKMHKFNIPYAEHIEKLDKIAQKLPKEQGKKLQDLNESVSSIVRNKSISDELKRELINEHFAELVDSITNKNIKRSLVNNINKIPLAHVSGDYLFCKLHRTKPTNFDDIVEFIIQPRKNTFEHVHARSLGGKDEINNGIYLCRRCNNERGNHPYSFIMKVFPEFKDNIQKQVSRLGTFIKNGSLIGYNNYPQGIKEQMKEVSGIDINIKSFLKKDKFNK